MLLALLLIPFLGSLLLFAWKGKSAKYVALVPAIAAMLVSFAMLSGADFSTTVDSDNLAYQIVTGESSFLRTSLHLGADGLSLLFILLTTILTSIIIFSTYSQNVPYKNSYYALILLMEFGMLGVFTALDGLVFYGFWEITLIPIWFIVGLWGQEDQRLRVNLKFFVYTFVGSICMLGGLIYVYIHSDSFALIDMYNADLNLTQQILVFWFIFAAFAVKLPLFPFHSWQPDTYTYASTEGTMLLSGLMLKMAIFGILRFLLPIAPLAIGGFSGKLVLVLAIIGVVYGALIAIVDNDAKRIFTFSSLSHIGLIVAAIFASAMLTLNGSFTLIGGEGALIQAFAHGINIVGLFYCADILFRRFGTRDIREMGGLAKVAPRFATLFMVILFGAMAVPFTNGFIGEFTLLKALSDYSLATVIIGGLTLILASAYFLRIYAKAMFGPGNAEKLAQLKDVNGVEFTVLAVLAGFVIYFGLFPNIIIEMVQSPLEFIFTSMTN